MQGSELKALAKVCELARVDIDPNAPLLLQSATGALTAHYRGQYSSAYRTVDSDAGELDIVVSAKQFRDTASLLDNDEEVKLGVAERGLVIRSRGSRFELRTVDRSVEPLTIPATATVRVRGGLQEEIDIAAKFVAKSMARPICTGIRLVLAKSWIGIEANDGFGSLLYRSQVPCKGPTETVRLVVPTFDFGLGLQITGDRRLTIFTDGKKIYLASKSAGFDCALLTGEWPVAQLPRSKEAQEFSIPTSTLKRAIAAVRLLDSHMDLHFTPSRKTDDLIRVTTASTTGEFVANIRGRLAGPVVYDSESLALVAEIGDELTFEAAPDEPLHASLGVRHAWLTSRV